MALRELGFECGSEVPLPATRYCISWGRDCIELPRHEPNLTHMPIPTVETSFCCYPLNIQRSSVERYERGPHFAETIRQRDHFAE